MWTSVRSRGPGPISDSQASDTSPENSVTEPGADRQWYWSGHGHAAPLQGNDELPSQHIVQNREKGGATMRESHRTKARCRRAVRAIPGTKARRRRAVRAIPGTKARYRRADRTVPALLILATFLIAGCRTHLSREGAGSKIWWSGRPASRDRTSVFLGGWE